MDFTMLGNLVTPAGLVLLPLVVAGLTGLAYQLGARGVNYYLLLAATPILAGLLGGVVIYAAEGDAWFLSGLLAVIVTIGILAKSPIQNAPVTPAQTAAVREKRRLRRQAKSEPSPDVEGIGTPGL